MNAGPENPEEGRPVSWLDGPATLNGEPFVMGDSFPWPIILYFWIVVAAGGSLFGWLLFLRFWPVDK